MLTYTLRRSGQGLLVLAGLTVITFLLEHLLPGNIARSILGVHANPATIAAFDKQNDLNRSILVQYAHFVDQLLHGNLGYSYTQNRSVDSMLASEAPRDVVLVGLSLALAIAIAVPTGIVQAMRRNRLVDHVGTGIAFTLYSMPPYVPALLAVEIFSIRLHWLPSEAPQASTAIGMLEHPAGLVLPVLTLTLVTYALFSRYMRSAVIDTLAQPFMHTARCKGLPERVIVTRHVLRNSLIAVVTLTGLSIPGILTAGLITEEVFNFPGVGLEYFNAATTNDFPTMLGITVVIGVVTILGNFLADVSYAILDPRVRL
ncbi:MAG: ABC transporter permease [Acidimicrobiales bacterium]